MLVFMLGFSTLILVHSTASHTLQYRADSITPLTQRNSTSSSGNDSTSGLLLPNLPISSNDFSLPTINSTSNFSTTGLGYQPPACERELNVNMNPRSCIDAYNMMVGYLRTLPKEKLTVGQRGEGVWDLPSPTRFLSSQSFPAMGLLEPRCI